MEKIDINPKKLKEYEKELINCNRYLPCVLRWAIDIQYMINVMQSPNSSEIMEQIDKTRDYTITEMYDELIQWCKDNPQYKNLLD